jgi:hypothetical protein
MSQDNDTLSANLDRLIMLADLAWQAPPEASARLACAFQYINRTFQTVVLAHQRAMQLSAQQAEIIAGHRQAEQRIPPADLHIMDKHIPE